MAKLVLSDLVHPLPTLYEAFHAHPGLAGVRLEPGASGHDLLTIHGTATVKGFDVRRALVSDSAKIELASNLHGRLQQAYEAMAEEIAQKMPTGTRIVRVLTDQAGGTSDELLR